MSKLHRNNPFRLSFLVQLLFRSFTLW